ncbi:MAG TPA: PfkB family carbohydrate kinase, partial [Blastocatellia bacterium]|nr:PfkB family carbohydrate kinase [Blastocatellia bacterium]
QTVSSLRTDLLILAGGPPVMEPRTGPAGELPASIIGLAGDSPQVSIDLEGTALDQSIRGRRQPDIIKINQAEYRSVESRRWEEFAGTLIVTSRDGCSVTGPGIHGPTTYVRGAVAESVYQTVGAGDATHAAFTIARWVWGFDDVRAARFGMAAAAAAVSSPDGTRGMTADRAHTIFSRLESEAIS